MRHEFYLFEGVDGTGKTSLSRGFAQLIGAKYHAGVPTILKPLKRFVDKNLPPWLRYRFYVFCNLIAYFQLKYLLKNTCVVMDQYIYCTAAYHSVSMNRNINTPRYAIIPTKIFYLETPWYEQDERITKRGNRCRLENINYLKKVDLAYRRLLSNMKNVVIYNNSGKTLNEHITAIASICK